jgi:hypothetical protein
MHNRVRLASSILLLAAALAARADVIEGSSTTLLGAGQQLRGAPAGQPPELVNVAPLFEIIRVSARDIRNPLFDDLEVTFSGWGSVDLASVRWDAGVDGEVTGDVTTAYVRGALAKGAVQLRLGREYVVAGAGRMLQIDGGDVFVRLPAGFTVSAFGGMPVAQRFSRAGTLTSWNPAGGDLAWGGRVGWSLALAGVAGRGLDLGVSLVSVTDHSDPVRQDVGLDFRIQPISRLVLVGGATWSTSAERLAEANLTALIPATRALTINLDVRKYSPDLFLARNSILSVFTDTDRTDVGGGVRYQFTRALSASLDYHLLIEPAAVEGQTEQGGEAAGRVEWKGNDALAGGELTWLKTGDTGYTGLRGYGRKDMGKLFVAGDLMEVMFKQEVNGFKNSLVGSLSAGYQFTRAWSLVLAGHAGVTPYFEQYADAMVKLVYNTVVRVREVK